MSAPRTTLRNARELQASGLIPAGQVAELEKVAARYAVAITPDMAALINPADAHDPIARQFIPDAAELQTRPQELADPIGDDIHSPVEGIVHRYPDRVLFKLVHVCAVYCRFCFRREMVGPGQKHALTPAALERALDYIRTHSGIWEVILTGGDPLVLSPRRLQSVVKQLAAIEHVRVLRIHTRVPVVDAARVTPALIRAVKSFGKAAYVVLHVNHARELTGKVRAACAALADAGIPLLSQSVLLKDVNDDTQTLGDLMRALVENRIKPYYLHHGDLAPGTGHLRTKLEAGQELMRALRGDYSGLCQPTYVLDIPGGHGKSPVGPNYLQGTETGYVVEDYRGELHRYPPAPQKRD